VTALLLLVWVAVLTAVALVPFVLPWKHRVRWMLTAQFLQDPVAGPLLRPGSLTAVMVVGVERNACGLTVDLAEELGQGQRRTYSLATGAGSPLATIRVEQWQRAGMPLLLFTDGGADVSLHGPASAVVGLRYWQDPGGGPPGHREPAPIPKPAWGWEREPRGVPA
jgi:hypothetical protein